jgi:hypothetical protein
MRGIRILVSGFAGLRSAFGVLAVVLGGLVFAVPLASAASITSGSASPLIGPVFCRGSLWLPPQCDAQAFDTSQDLAYQGNGFARPAVAKDVLPGYSPIHLPQNVNDGLYGNGASWISNSPNSWVRIDLGRTVTFDELTFGRDRLGFFSDRPPGQFTISVSTDGTNYRQVLDSSTLEFSGYVPLGGTVSAQFEPTTARWVELTVANAGADIDEIEVFSCNEGGWQSLNDANGNTFENQGGCVSSLATGGKNAAG